MPDGEGRLTEDDVRAAAAVALGRPVEELSYAVDAVDPHLRIHSVTGGVHRVRGSADGAPFSAIAKVTVHGTDDDPRALWVSGAEESHRNYWKREYLAYTSGLLAGLPGRLCAPRLLHAHEPDGRTAVLWLEDVAGLPGERFQPQHLARAARDLGSTQAPYAVPAGAAGARALPDQPWLSRGWLAAWVDTADRWWDRLDEPAWRDERLGPLAALRPAARDLWAERARLLRVVDEAPQTVVHLDFWPTNLIAADDGRTVALDWSSVGVGGLAQDLDQLSLDPVWMQVVPGADLGLLERAVLPAYAWGLREAGLPVTDAEVRRWYAATAGVRYLSVLAAQVDLVAPERAAAQERRWGRPLADILADRARVVARAAELAGEVLAPG